MPAMCNLHIFLFLACFDMLIEEKYVSDVIISSFYHKNNLKCVLVLNS